MVLNSKKEIYNGVIKSILIPREFNEYNELKEEYEVSNIWFKVLVDNKEIDVIVPRTSGYGNFFVGDLVKLEKNIILYDEFEFKKVLEKQIDMYCSHMTIEKRKEKYMELVNIANNYVISYDIKEV